MQKLKRERLTPVLLFLTGLFFPGCEGKKAVDADPVKVEKKQEEHEESREKDVRLTAEQQERAGIKLMEVLERPVPNFLEVSGSFAPDTDRTIPINPPVAGILKEITASLGDSVSTGKKLATIQSGTEDVVVNAPKSGVVVGLLVSPGDRVDPVAPFMTLADLRVLRCILDVYEKDIGRVRKGQEVRLEVAAFPGRTFHGKVDYLSPRVDPETRSVKVRVDVDNSSGELRFGMFATARIVVSEKRTLAVPLEAVQKDEDISFVFVSEKPDTFEKRIIKTGQESSGWVEILDGVKSGEQVVAKGSFVVKSEMMKSSLGDND